MLDAARAKSASVVILWGEGGWAEGLSKYGAVAFFGYLESQRWSEYTTGLEQASQF